MGDTSEPVRWDRTGDARASVRAAKPAVEGYGTDMARISYRSGEQVLGRSDRLYLDADGVLGLLQGALEHVHRSIAEQKVQGDLSDVETYWRGNASPTSGRGWFPASAGSCHSGEPANGLLCDRSG